MLSISTQFAAYAPAAQPLVQARASVVMESKASLEALAKELNPSIGYWDPIGLANLGGNDGSPASGEAVGADSIGQERFIGYLRHSEIKHGRIAMAGFVGYCLQVRVCAPRAAAAAAAATPPPPRCRRRADAPTPCAPR